jgi:hypothetical protein
MSKKKEDDKNLEVCKPEDSECKIEVSDVNRPKAVAKKILLDSDLNLSCSDVEKEIMATKKLLEDIQKKFGTWYLQKKNKELDSAASSRVTRL